MNSFKSRSKLNTSADIGTGMSELIYDMRLETRSLGSCLFKDKILLIISQDRSVAGVFGSSSGRE